MTQTQNHTTPQNNGTIPPNHIGPLVPQPPLPTLHTGALPLAPPLPTLPTNRTTSNTDDSIGSDHITMDVGPHDAISTFLLHIQHAADDAASSSSHDVTANSADGNKATAASAIGTGDVDTGGGASAPPAELATDTTNNPTGLNGTIPMGPSDNTQVANTADPAGASQPPSPANICVNIGAVATPSVMSHANGKLAVATTERPRMNTRVCVGRLSSSPCKATRRPAHDPQGGLPTR